MKLRPADTSDSAAVRGLVFGVLAEYGLAPDPAGTDADLVDVVASYASCGGVFDMLVADDGAIVGTVGLYPLRSTVCELRKMYLAKDARGKGYGRRLLEHAIARARDLGFRRIELETSSKLEDAIRMYRRYGFTSIPVASHHATRCDESYALDLECED